MKQFTFFGYLISINKIKKESEASVNTFVLEPGRRTGRTTRLVDSFINELFTQGQVKVYDHHPLNHSSLMVLKMVLKRLKSEHGIDESDLIINRSKLLIHLK